MAPATNKAVALSNQNTSFRKLIAVPPAGVAVECASCGNISSQKTSDHFARPEYVMNFLSNFSQNVFSNFPFKRGPPPPSPLPPPPANSSNKREPKHHFLKHARARALHSPASLKKSAAIRPEVLEVSLQEPGEVNVRAKQSSRRTEHEGFKLGSLSLRIPSLPFSNKKAVIHPVPNGEQLSMGLHLEGTLEDRDSKGEVPPTSRAGAANDEMRQDGSAGCSPASSSYAEAVRGGEGSAVLPTRRRPFRGIRSLEKIVSFVKMQKRDTEVGAQATPPADGVASSSNMKGEEDADKTGDVSLRFSALDESSRAEGQLAPVDRVKEAMGEWMEKFPLLRRGQQNHPDKQRLTSVQDFFKYTEAEGRKLFEELDADGDGQVGLDDLEAAMRRRRLPRRYARAFLRRARRSWLASSFGWEEFLSLMEQREPSMLRAFNSLVVAPSGALQKSQVLASLRRAGLPATASNVKAMMQFLDADTERGQVAYGQFRNFMLLLPPERLGGDPSMVWFEAATVVPMAPPMEVPAGSVLKSALAGGLACGLSTCIMHPLDTMKTLVQASTLSLGEVVGSLPSLGLRGLYRGSIPAILGQFASHGLRTGAFEATKLGLARVNPDLTEMQIQPIASLGSAVLGTAIRIPCEVLKQRLQAGMYADVGAALAGTLRQDGVAGLFRGTTATLFREVPFYVAGLLIYQEAKKVARNGLRRDLAPWETLLVGGVSGGLAAVSTTPFDVIKTRMMTGAPGATQGLIGVGVSVIQSEGVLALYKGALPRFFWIAPLGAMSFAGYELAKQAMDKEEGGERRQLVAASS
eukprot:jgi/Mesen1/5393/ME000268S04588